jgi:5-methylcytosine-specific restriction protein A
LGLNEPVCKLSGMPKAIPSASTFLPNDGQESRATRTSGQWRLTEEQKQEATRFYEAGESIGAVANRYGVSRQSMHDVLKRRTEMRDRIAALPRKEPTAIRTKRLRALRRYRARAARITRAQIRAVMERDVHCVACGALGTDIDHIRPVSEGGQTEMDNLQLLCHPCHIEKSRADWRIRTRWKEVS